MNRGYGQGKRQREDEKARKQKEKDRRRMERREMGPGEIPVQSAAELQEASPSIEDIMRSLERGGGGEDRSASSVPARLFVGGLSDEVTEDDLAQAFGQFGRIADCIVMRDRDSRQPRGFGFVTMADRKDAPRAIAGLDGTDLKGRTLVVNVATERGR
ncbi:RNA recognition motif domain-containing protein [Sandaracinus amylolyticus]|uniref:RNA recognition motif domain-containing protein n=1 Tax=Sandaracinus amylolyticus TaxID=927083 RepID=UPI001F440A8A|nr:RNA-binding protein [Sandaracinus amylolyticus]UJR85631.1 Hypothetical protein I5071_77110 [Sandaracinus amylolyticus]